MAKVAICQKPTCTTCRQTMTIMNESGVDFEAVNSAILMKYSSQFIPIIASPSTASS